MNEEPSNELLFPEELPPDHRSGYVSLLGKPNVGKSTLLNALMGQKISIVSDKPQTTRDAILAILTRPEAQIVFMDTPGLHRPQHKLGEFMVETARRTVEDADLVCWVVDVSTLPTEGDRHIAQFLQQPRTPPILLVLNKADLVTERVQATNAEAYRALGDFAGEVPVSALHGSNLDTLLAEIIARLPVGPRYYPEEQVTDRMERFIVAELIREQALSYLRQEIPYVLAVEVENFEEHPEGVTRIEANIYVEKDSQKGILIGRGGSMLKQIGQSARQEIEKFLEQRVHLELWIKVRENWRKKDEELRRLGYATPKQGDRD